MSGKDLQIARIRAGIKQYEMAEALKMNRSLLSQIENDRIKIPESVEQVYLDKVRELKRQKGWNL